MGRILLGAMVLLVPASTIAQVSGKAGRDNNQYSCTVLSTKSKASKGSCVCRSPFACHQMVLDRVCRGSFRKSIEQMKCSRGSNECSCEWNGVTKPASVDHRVPNTETPRQSEVVTARRGTLTAPSDVTLSDIRRTSLLLAWMDNSRKEHGVSVERGTPVKTRGGINYNWKRVFNVEERVESRTEGTGWRSDRDDGLSPNTEYCYRLRAYRNGAFSEYSAPVCSRTKR
mgnify:FL=1